MTWGNSMKFSGKMCFKIILKVTKNQGSTHSIDDTFFKKYRRGQFDRPRHIRVKYVRKFSEKLIFLTLWYAHVRTHIGGKKCYFFGIHCVRTKWMIPYHKVRKVLIQEKVGWKDKGEFRIQSNNSAGAFL